MNFGNAVSDKGIVYLKSFSKVYAIEEIQIKEIKQKYRNNLDFTFYREFLQEEQWNGQLCPRQNL